MAHNRTNFHFFKYFSVRHKLHPYDLFYNDTNNSWHYDHVIWTNITDTIFDVDLAYKTYQKLVKNNFYYFFS